MPADSSDSRDVEAADVNGDGRLDLLFAGNSFVPGTGSTSRVLLAGPGGFVELAGALDDAPALARHVAAGDLDGDGDLDVVVADANGSTAVLAGDGTGSFQPIGATVPVEADATQSVLLLDADGDSDLDVVLGNALPGRERPWLGDGAGAFADATEFGGAIELLEQSAADLAAGDLDGNGAPDLLLLGAERLLLGDGTGGLDEAPDVLPSLSNALRVELGDVEPDGDLDAAVLAAGGGPAGAGEVWVNDGTGSLAALVALPSVPGLPRDLALGDLDGDGDLDAVVTTVSDEIYDVGAEDRWLRNDGASFTAQPLPGGATSGRAAAVADVDLDGDLDVLVATRQFCTSLPDCPMLLGGETLLHRGDGFGGFALDSAAFPPDTDASETIAAGDLDGDAFPEVFVGSVAAQPDRLYRNVFGASFVDASPALPESLGATDVALVDVDGDGPLDVLLANGNGGVRLWKGDGALGLADATALVEQPLESGFGVQALAPVDLDGDGDLDVAGGGSPRNLLWSGLGRQLAAGAPGGTGKDLPLEVHGGPSDLFVLALALAPAEIPVEGLGVLELDPSALLTLAAQGFLDAAGRATVPIPVPSDPALSGVVVHWQALLLGPGELGFTSREPVELATF